MHKIPSIRVLAIYLGILSALIFSAFSSLSHTHAASIQPFTLDGTASGNVSRLEFHKGI